MVRGVAYATGLWWRRTASFLRISSNRWCVQCMYRTTSNIIIEVSPGAVFVCTDVWTAFQTQMWQNKSNVPTENKRRSRSFLDRHSCSLVNTSMSGTRRNWGRNTAVDELSAGLGSPLAVYSWTCWRGFSIRDRGVLGLLSDRQERV